MSFLEEMRKAGRQLDALPPDPWRKIIAHAIDGVEAMSTVALLDLVGARPTTSNARRLAAIMRDLKFIPIQSRRLLPGGFRDTVTRGWARPLRGVKVERQGAAATRINEKKGPRHVF
ncbi:hypothetical protein [Bradyrhizobium elkanii]|uniref:hypothetical protein n=1 Tax=Bradyrhizobium elkanii TaxID=29448 RepID=UPI00042080A5|nr:hypothetical protein [Bradyrhizobium elkanii]